MTTDDVADALRNFFRAAQRRGRVVRIEVPIVPDAITGESMLALILSPGESLHITASDEPHVELEARALIRSLDLRVLAWNARTQS